MGFPCRKCPDTTSGVALAAVTAIATIVAVGVLTSYLISGEDVHGRGGGKIECLTRYIPLQSVKIVIVTWQILTQVGGCRVVSGARAKVPSILTLELMSGPKTGDKQIFPAKISFERVSCRGRPYSTLSAQESPPIVLLGTQDSRLIVLSILLC